MRPGLSDSTRRTRARDRRPRQCWNCGNGAARRRSRIRRGPALSAPRRVVLRCGSTSDARRDVRGPPPADASGHRPFGFGSVEDNADERGLRIGIRLTVMLETGGQPALKRGVLGGDVGVRPQVVAERELVAKAPRRVGNEVQMMGSAIRGGLTAPAHLASAIGRVQVADLRQRLEAPPRRRKITNTHQDVDDRLVRRGLAPPCSPRGGYRRPPNRRSPPRAHLAPPRSGPATWGRRPPHARARRSTARHSRPARPAGRSRHRPRSRSYCVRGCGRQRAHGHSKSRLAPEGIRDDGGETLAGAGNLDIQQHTVGPQFVVEQH
jgi:hypothetical protein